VSETEDQRRNVLERCCVWSKDGEWACVLEALSALVPHLARWDPDDLDVKISVKDRDGKEQHITLRVDLPGYSPLVAVVADLWGSRTWPSLVSSGFMLSVRTRRSGPIPVGA
jgi:hypothetical protein